MSLARTSPDHGARTISAPWWDNAHNAEQREGHDMESEPELMLEDARSIQEVLWRMVRLAQDTAETLDARIEDETLDGRTEAVEVREALQRLQDLSLEVSEELDAYQQRHAR